MSGVRSPEWYELAIRVSGVADRLTWKVGNGENGGYELAQRHYWPSHEEQQVDIAELWEVVREIEYAKSFESFHEAMNESYRRSQLYYCKCGSHNGFNTPGNCCDPNDCGPCCPNCPTCPTLHPELGTKWPERAAELEDEDE